MSSRYEVWTSTSPANVQDSTSRAEGPGATFTEVRMHLGEAAGELQVSHRRGDADAAADRCVAQTRHRAPTAS